MCSKSSPQNLPKVRISKLALLDFIQYNFLGGYRSIKKRKFYSVINVIGLSIGITVSIFIYLFVSDELSFDQFHENSERIYRMETSIYIPPENVGENFEMWHLPELPDPLISIIKQEIPQIEAGTRYKSSYGKPVVKFEPSVFSEKLTYVDQDFFKIFSFKTLHGNVGTSFKKNEVILTETLAKKYFGNGDPIDKVLSIKTDEAETFFTIKAVIEDAPANSSLQFQILLPVEAWEYYEDYKSEWTEYTYSYFVLLQKSSSPEQFKASLDKIVHKYLGSNIADRTKKDEVPPGIKALEFNFKPITEIHWDTQVPWEKSTSRQFSLILSGIAFVILIIAIINYVSLAMTTYAKREVEVGIKKVYGAGPRQLLFQFSTEAIILTFFSFILSTFLVAFLLPIFNDFTGKAFAITNLQLNFYDVLFFVFLIAGVGLLSGAYPSFFLSRLTPHHVLKNQFTTGFSGSTSSTLLFVQFTLSLFLITCSVTMYKEMKLVSNFDLGFDRQHVVILPTQAGNTPESNEIVDLYRTQLEAHHDIVSVAGVNAAFYKRLSSMGFEYEGSNKKSKVFSVDPYYIQAMGIKIISGRNFDPNNEADKNGVIVNEKLIGDVNNLKLDDRIVWGSDSMRVGSKVIGIVKDYNFKSLEFPVEPLFLTMRYEDAGYLSTIVVKIASTDIHRTITTLAREWKKLFPDKPFEYSFLDEDVEKQYQTYLRWNQIMTVSTVFAVLIAFMGIFGLAGVNALNRTREIGVRKVLGANGFSIFFLLNRHYLFVSIAAFLIAAPISWYVMNKWLSAFEYRVEIGWDIYAISMLTGMLVCAVGVSYHGLKALLANPAKALRHE